jgi:hypothetical protein
MSVISTFRKGKVGGLRSKPSLIKKHKILSKI